MSAQPRRVPGAPLNGMVVVGTMGTLLFVSLLFPSVLLPHPFFLEAPSLPPPPLASDTAAPRMRHPLRCRTLDCVRRAPPPSLGGRASHLTYPRPPPPSLPFAPRHKSAVGHWWDLATRLDDDIDGGALSGATAATTSALASAGAAASPGASTAAAALAASAPRRRCLAKPRYVRLNCCLQLALFPEAGGVPDLDSADADWCAPEIVTLCNLMFPNCPTKTSQKADWFALITSCAWYLPACLIYNVPQDAVIQ